MLPDNFYQFGIRQLIDMFFQMKESGSGSLKELQQLLRDKWSMLSIEQQNNFIYDVDNKNFYLYEALNEEI